MKLTLHIWRQASPEARGAFKTYRVDNISEDSSFLELLDVLNLQLERAGEVPVHFDHDCREGICGMCSLYINGHPHGPGQTTTCQLHMRSFRDGQDIWIEPWRAKPFRVLKDLVVDRSSFDRVIQAGGYVSVSTGGVPDANEIAIPKDVASGAMDAAACIGCGACVAACKNASAMLFVAAKVTHLNSLPQGKIEAQRRVTNMVDQMNAEGFGACTNTKACSAACPKEIDVSVIAYMNKAYLAAKT